ncbi:unnamed protein product [Blepharisma stoltei]|uniref:Upf1 domain-containing protein n=1 Tax=Blepharisma stoltei TaxID=1481888 RepID=A0AAU9JKK4_9CILI|nr:unnamed protein product [Blepharisma stoltei]
MSEDWTDVYQESLSSESHNENDWDNIEEISCIYCKNSDPSSLVRCTFEKCAWYCNSSVKGVSDSHIVAHLTKAGHKKIALHPSNSFSGFPIECAECSQQNIFLLGIVLSRSSNEIKYLCRNPCGLNSKLQEDQWDLAGWQPCISERSITSLLVKSNQTELSQALNISMKKIAVIEKNVKKGLDPEDPEPELPPVNKVQLRYKSAREYVDIFERLVRIEENLEKMRKSQQVISGFVITWDLRDKKNILARFVVSRENTDVRLVIGDEVKLFYKKQKEFWIGIIFAYNAEDEVTLKIIGNHEGLPKKTKGFTLKFVEGNDTYIRMINGLRMFEHGYMDTYIGRTILGQDREKIKRKVKLPNNLTPPNQKALNHHQTEAVRAALKSKFMMIQGPPGTGKTSTSVAIIYHMLKKFNEQILACAPSNNAADQLALRLESCGVKVLRVVARSREALKSETDHLALHNLIYKNSDRDYKKLQDKIDEGSKLTVAERKKHTKLYYNTSDRLLSEAEVIVTTCIGAFDKRLEDFEFKRVLIDDATLATEPESLLPMLACAEQVIMVGDHCQLGPISFAGLSTKAGYNHSLFERLIRLGVESCFLNTQYRMHPSISEFSNIHFYNNSLINGVTSQLRQYYGTASFWTNIKTPIFFYNIIGSEEQSATGKSFINREEAKTIEIIVTQLLKAKIKANNIGVVTPYQGQKSFISSYLYHKGTLGKKKYEDLSVSTIDEFQGKEKDFIVISLVRSNGSSKLGFLADFRRINVALTRAKYGLIICGNAGLFSGDQLWNILLNFLSEKEAIFEGPLNQLTLSSIQLPKPVLPYDTTSYFKYAEIEGEIINAEPLANTEMVNELDGQKDFF